MLTPPAPTYIDLGIVVALQEEFRELMKLIPSYGSDTDGELTSYYFERSGYQLVAAFVGHKGESQITRVTERLIARWRPGGIVVVGIAAGVHEDLRVGDAHIPLQAGQYMQNAKAIPRTTRKTKKKIQNGSDEFVLVPGAPVYRADHGFIESIQNMEFKNPDGYKKFRSECEMDLQQSVSKSDLDRLLEKRLVRGIPELLSDGHVATGPVVGAAESFSSWIRSHDRDVKSLEMESAAVLLAAQSRTNPTPAFIIRGISDYGDDRKRELDSLGEGALRKYAMRNAVRLLWTMLDGGGLPRNPH